MKNPTILITGAGKGIGRAIAEGFIREASASYRPQLVLTSRTASDLEPLGAAAQEARLSALLIARDLASSGAPQSIVQQAIQTFGSIDVLINNAGVGRFGAFLEATEEDIDFVLETNLKATFLLTQAVYREMSSKRSGHIVFVTSVAAEKAFEQSAIYCMSKFGQRGLVEVLRLYGYQEGIRITNIEPGAVYTPMWGPAAEQFKERMLRPEDVASLVVAAVRLPDRASVEEIVLRPISGDL